MNNMEILLSFVVILILTIKAVLCYKKGLIRFLSPLISTVLSYILTIFTYRSFYRFITEKTKIMSFIKYMATDLSVSFHMRIPDSVIEAAVSVIARIVLLCIYTFVLRFLISRIMRMINIQTRTPIISMLNSIFGAIAGIVECIAVIWIIFSIAHYGRAIGWINTIYETMQNIPVVAFLNKGNLFV